MKNYSNMSTSKLINVSSDGGYRRLQKMTKKDLLELNLVETELDNKQTKEESSASAISDLDR